MGENPTQTISQSLQELICKEEHLRRSLQFYETALNLLQKQEYLSFTQKDKQNEPHYEIKEFSSHENTNRNTILKILDPPSNPQDENQWNLYIETLCKHLETLQETLFQLNAQIIEQQLLLQRVRENRVVQQTIFSSSNDSQSLQTQKLKELFRIRDEKANSSLQLHKQLQTLSEEVYEWTQKNEEVKNSIREKWKKLRTLQQQQQQQGMSPVERTKKNPLTIEKEVAYLEDQNTIVRHVFQTLIIESGINWAEDDELRELFLSLSEPL